MKSKKISIKSIVIIILISIISILILVIMKNKNQNIDKEILIKEQLGETTTDSAYVSMDTHLLEIKEKQKELDNLQNAMGQVTTTIREIQTGTFYYSGNGTVVQFEKEFSEPPNKIYLRGLESAHGYEYLCYNQGATNGTNNSNITTNNMTLKYVFSWSGSGSANPGSTPYIGNISYIAIVEK
mgnify:CR=1 FL=1